MSNTRHSWVYEGRLGAPEPMYIDVCRYCGVARRRSWVLKQTSPGAAGIETGDPS